MVTTSFNEITILQSFTCSYEWQIRYFSDLRMFEEKQVHIWVENLYCVSKVIWINIL